MNRIKSYLTMRYEMFLARMFNLIVKLLRKTRLDDYPETVLWSKELDWVYDQLFETNERCIEQDEFISYLLKESYDYEYQDEEED